MSKNNGNIAISEEWMEYDNNNNLIHYKKESNEYSYCDDYEAFYSYDDRGNRISSTNCNGQIDHYKYDENNNLIYFKSIENNFKVWKTYNYEGKITNIINSLGDGQVWEYDEDGNETLYTNSAGRRIVKEYKNGIITKETDYLSIYNDAIITRIYDNGKIISKETAKGITRYKYDERGNMTCRVGPNSKEKWIYDNNNNIIIRRLDSPHRSVDDYMKYDENNKLIERKCTYMNSDGDIYHEFERTYRYDNKGNEIYGQIIGETVSGNREYTYEYDNKNREVLYKDTDGNERIKEYDENGNNIYIKNIHIVYDDEV